MYILRKYWKVGLPKICLRKVLRIRRIVDELGPFSYYAQIVFFLYYTNFLDIIAYNIPEDYVIHHCESCNSVERDFANEIRVIELKRDYIPDVALVVNQIAGYMKWANTVLNENASVTGFIVANGFNSDYKYFAQSSNNIHFVHLKHGKNQS